MKKNSVIASILVLFWFGYVIFSIGSSLLHSSQLYESELERRKSIVDFHLDLGVHFLSNKKTDALLSRLYTARELNEFDFFILRSDKEVFGYYNQGSSFDGLLAQTEIGEFITGNRTVYKTIKVGDYFLTLGVFHKTETFLLAQFKSMRTAIIIDVVVVTALVFFIVYVLLKDILQISKILQSKSRGDLSNIKTRSKEAEVLLRAAEGFEVTTRGLRQDNLLLASTLAPAVRAELKSGNTPPYSIACTVGRVDLNGYTQLVLEKNPNELLHILNEYFSRARDIIERYQGGMIYQYVGDEIVFIFKESEVFQDSSSLQRAIGAVRSLFEMADSLKTSGLPQGLKLKSSLVKGELRFIQLDQGYSFSGLPLIETVRMLGQVSEKNESALILYSENAESVKDFCEITNSKVTVFKGFTSESHLIEVKKFSSISQAAVVLHPGQLADCFRSDQDLVYIIKELTHCFEKKDLLTFFKIIGSLRGLVVDRVSEDVVHAYNACLSALLIHKEHEKIESKFLAAIVSLSQNLLNKNFVTDEFVKSLELCGDALDPRVQANALVSKAHFDIDIDEIGKKMRSENNRIAADAVMVAGKIDFDQDLYERVVEFLESDKPRFQASGLYIIAAMIDYYCERDLVYLKANKYLKSLSSEIKKYVDHPDEMVKNRARLSQAIIDKVGVYAH